MPDSHHAPKIVVRPFSVTRVSTNAAGIQGDGDSRIPVFSPDGTKVAFQSLAANLVSGDTNNSEDIFVKDLTTGAITRVSTDAAGRQGNGGSVEAVFSPDGSKVVFLSLASNLVANDTNGRYDLFVKDLVTGAITRVSTSSSGGQGDNESGQATFSPDGTKLAFTSTAKNLVSGDTNGFTDVFVKDLITGATTRISTNASGTQGNRFAQNPVFTPDGTKVLFETYATNLVSDGGAGAELLVKDLTTGALTRLSTNSLGVATNNSSIDAVFSRDGTKVAFTSYANNLVAGDTNSRTDIFVKDLTTGTVTRVSTNDANEQADGNSQTVAFSPDGNTVVFKSDASNLVEGDTNGVKDIFVALPGTLVTAGSLTEDGTATVGGSFGFSDADTSDAHEVSVAAATGGTLGTFSASLSHDTTGSGAGGQIAWSYAVDNAFLQYLKAGETKVETFAVRVSDGVDTTEQAVSVTIIGVNDAPALTGPAAALADGLRDHVYSVTRAQLRQGWTDVDGDDWGVANVTSNHGTVSYEAGTDSYVLTPETGYVGPVAISYKVTDSHVDVAASLSFGLAGNNAPKIVTSTSTISRVSTNAAGEQANGMSYDAAFSPDGTKVVFASVATNLISGIGGGPIHVFVKNLTTGGIVLVSANASGDPANSVSHNPVFSPDGTKVMFTSYGDNLVSGDRNHSDDIFVKTLATGAVTRINTNGLGQESNSLSEGAVFSPDGSKVAFASYASNLVSGHTHGSGDIFVKDLSTGIVIQASTSVSGTPGNAHSEGVVFSPDGSKVAFSSYANNLVAGDTNGLADIFVKDLTSGVITRVSTDAFGGQANGSSFASLFSPDGSRMAFTSEASNLVGGDTNGKTDIFIKDLTTGAITRVSTDASGGQANDASFDGRFSPDGAKLVFHSNASNLASGDTDQVFDVFIKDLSTGAVTRLSAGLNTSSRAPEFSSDGARVLFASEAMNLVAGDSNNAEDIFVSTLNTASFASWVGEDNTVTSGGSFGFTDADVLDTHTVSTAAPAGGTLGVFSASLAHDTTGTGLGGEITWSYAVDNATIQYLTAGETKVETFTVQISDGADITEQALAVTITGVNDAPALTGAAATLPDGVTDVAYSVSRAHLMQGWTDADGDSLSVTQVSADHGTVNYDSGTDSYVVVPATGYIGPVVISYKVTDAHVQVSASRSFGLGSGLVTSPVTTTLQPGQHDLFLTGSDDIDGYGNGSDNVLTGNRGDNLLSGNDGHDRLYGGKGHDTLYGGDGDDRLDGGSHADVMYGGLGNDTYSVANSSDVVVELPGEGTDTVKTDLRAYVLGANLENLVLTGTRNIGGTGNGLDNVMYGNGANNALNGGIGNDSLFGGRGNDSLSGNDGDDQLDGGVGSDTLAGGAGNDVYLQGQTHDLIEEGNGAGIDTVKANSHYALDGNVENLILTGSANLNGTGNSLDNVITGNGGDNNLEGGAGRDLLYGGKGNDRLVGGADADTMYGGLGSDTYSVANSADVVVELANEGAQDTVKTDLYIYVLGDNIENLILRGTHDSRGGGNALNNIMYGNGTDNQLYGVDGNDNLFGGKGNDTLDGGAGNDRLDGGSGADVLIGSFGNDSYSVDSVDDQVVESTDGGNDTVKTGLDGYVLGAFVENLILVGAGSIGGAGNELGNVIVGNGADNWVQGGAGADTLSGGLGHDTFVFTALTDSLKTAVDRIIDLSSDDVIDLRLIDANVHQDGDQAFHLVSAFTHHGAEMVLYYQPGAARTTLTVDVDGDGAVDFAIFINGNHTDPAGWLL